MIEELQDLVRELIDGGIDRIALNKTLCILRADSDVSAEMERLYNYWTELSDRRLVELMQHLQALPTMSPAELDALQWFDECGDCRARAWVDLKEDFYVHNNIWEQACPADPDIMLCVDCIEHRLGRQLTSADFRNPEYQIVRGKIGQKNIWRLERLLGRKNLTPADVLDERYHPHASARLMKRLYADLNTDDAAESRVNPEPAAPARSQLS
jgi:hypothetical protein